MGANLQQLQKGFPSAECKRAMYRIFNNVDMDSMVNDIILEQECRAPEEAGEIFLIDNRTVLHAIYYRYGKDYSIGVGYLFKHPTTRR
jgi:hypothetical protein